jgi:hypothetical protein
MLATGQTKHLFCNRDLNAARMPPRYYAQFGLE